MKLQNLKSYFVRFTDEYLFWPNNVLVEWFSALMMVGWLVRLLSEGDVMLARQIYTGFQGVSTNGWVVIFGLALFAHLASLVYRGRQAILLRYTAIVLATAIWTFVTINFMAFAPPNMAAWTFGSLAFTCFILGIRIAWTSSLHTY